MSFEAIRDSSYLFGSTFYNIASGAVIPLLAAYGAYKVIEHVGILSRIKSMYKTAYIIYKSEVAFDPKTASEDDIDMLRAGARERKKAMELTEKAKFHQQQAKEYTDKAGHLTPRDPILECARNLLRKSPCGKENTKTGRHWVGGSRTSKSITRELQARIDKDRLIAGAVRDSWAGKKAAVRSEIEANLNRLVIKRDITFSDKAAIIAQLKF